MKKYVLLSILFLLSYIFTQPAYPQSAPLISDHLTAKLSLISEEDVALAKSTLHIAYGHTSHGSQIITGMEGLLLFKTGYDTLYAFNDGGAGGALDLCDTPFSGADDLGAPNRTAWATATRHYLDAHAEVNVVIWSWCGQVSSATEADINTYLTLMDALEQDYPAVSFVYMTGHLDGTGTGVDGILHARNEQIREYCRLHNKILYDFADIESYDPDGNYFLDRLANDNCDYDSDGDGNLEPGGDDGNWAVDWQTAHTEGVDWYDCAPAHTQALNGNLKAYAAWYLWAGIAKRRQGIDIYCVSHATELQTALTTAQSNAKEALIMVVQGTYVGNFEYDSTQGYGITLLGGYIAGCVGRAVNPANTILDGGGAGRVLYLNYNYSGDIPGNIHVDGFTIRNGSKNSYGGGVYAASYASSSNPGGDVTLTNNIIQGNTAGGGFSGGGVYAYSASYSGTSGTVTLFNNIITGNTATSGNGGGVDAESFSDSGTAATFILINNIIAGNAAGNNGGGAFVESYTSTGTAGPVNLTNNTITGNAADGDGGGLCTAKDGSTINLYNNIIWGNTAATDGGDIYLFGTAGTANAYNNDAAALAGTSWDTYVDYISADPLFVDPVHGDYHLQLLSPCVDAGVNSASAIPVNDFEGDARIIDGNNDGTASVDIGADEYGSVIAAVAPAEGAIFGGCALISKYQPAFQWLALETFRTFTIYFSTSSTDFSTKGVLITKANIKGTKFSYTLSIGTWKKIMKASYNNGGIRPIYWKVVGKRADKSTEESGIRSFSIDYPYYPEIQSPLEAAALPAATPPTFIFYTNCNVKFRLEISPLVGFTDPKQTKAFTYTIRDPNITTSLSKTLSSGQWKAVQKLITGTGYFRIRAWDGIKRETSSETRSFTITIL